MKQPVAIFPARKTETDELVMCVMVSAYDAETERGNYWFDQSYACEEEIKRLRALLGRVVGTPLSSRTIDGGTFISGELLRDIEAGMGTTVTVKEVQHE